VRIKAIEELLLRGSKFLAGGYSADPVSDHQAHLLPLIRSKYSSIRCRNVKVIEPTYLKEILRIAELDIA